MVLSTFSIFSFFFFQLFPFSTFSFYFLRLCSNSYSFSALPFRYFAYTSFFSFSFSSVFSYTSDNNPILLSFSLPYLGFFIFDYFWQSFLTVYWRWLYFMFAHLFGIISLLSFYDFSVSIFLLVFPLYYILTFFLYFRINIYSFDYSRLTLGFYSSFSSVIIACTFLVGSCSVLFYFLILSLLRYDYQTSAFDRLSDGVLESFRSFSGRAQEAQYLQSWRNTRRSSQWHQLERTYDRSVLSVPQSR